MTLNGHLMLSDCKINTGHIIISVFGLSSVLQGSQSSVIHVFSTQLGRRVWLLNTDTRTIFFWSSTVLKFLFHEFADILCKTSLQGAWAQQILSFHKPSLQKPTPRCARRVHKIISINISLTDSERRSSVVPLSRKILFHTIPTTLHRVLSHRHWARPSISNSPCLRLSSFILYVDPCGQWAEGG